MDFSMGDAISEATTGPVTPNKNTKAKTAVNQNLMFMVAPPY
jgi:hypothetical protein